MTPESTLWPRQPHTEGKHLVLREYLNRWLPIMTRYNQRVVFIDGFAGPGEYEEGEEGSPLVALRALSEHHYQKSIAAEIVYLFIENDPGRAEHLEQLLDRVRPELPDNATFQVVPGTFEDAMSTALDGLAEAGSQLAPSFVMIDPFGVSGLPMELIGRILRNPKCEVYISFMYESMNRFLERPEFESHLDALFGTGRWRQAASLVGDERKRFLYGLYESQLKEAGAEQVLHFDLYEGNRLIYAIFFGTQDLKGSNKMKEAIWKVAPAGDFSFRGSKSGQLELNVDQPDFRVLRQQLIDRFRGEGWIGIEDIEDFVASDATDFHTSQLKRPVLKPLEKDGIVEVDESTRKKRWTFPSGTRLRFNV